MMPNEHLVSIGLPTYNRAATLQRAVESALNQDYRNIELVISDNASTDETEAICQAAARNDSRVKYLRQQTNQGAAENFRDVLRKSSGEFFMWLADDDWLAPDYISRCTQVLVGDSEYSIACGAVKHCADDGSVVRDGDCIDLPQSSGGERVLEYLRQIRYDGTFYGVMRREQLLQEPLKNTLAGDWLFSAAIIFTGKVKNVGETFLYRSGGGASATMESVLRSVDMPLVFAKSENLFYLKIATSVFYQILVVSPSFKSIGVLKRFSLACAAVRIIQQRFMLFRWAIPVRRVLHQLRSKVRTALLMLM
jgi:glycosyltransferase involved in cell wall biosynthesis